jgi:hypothetical protein
MRNILLFTSIWYEIQYNITINFVSYNCNSYRNNATLEQSPCNRRVHSSLDKIFPTKCIWLPLMVLIVGLINGIPCLLMMGETCCSFLISLCHQNTIHQSSYHSALHRLRRWPRSTTKPPKRKVNRENMHVISHILLTWLRDTAANYVFARETHELVRNPFFSQVKRLNAIRQVSIARSIWL